MSASSENPPVSPNDFRRSWRTVTIAGSLGTVWGTICLGGAPRTKFLTELHATPYHFGLIAAFSSLSLVFQLFSGVLSSHIKARKPLWMALTIIHRLLFLGVLAAPVLFVRSETIRIWWIIAVLLFHDSLMNFASPLWTSWMADLVPRESMSRHWATRQRFTNHVFIAASVGVAVAFAGFEKQHAAVLGFTILGVVGVIVGVIDILLFKTVPDVPSEGDSENGVIRTLVQPLRDPDFRRYTFFLGYWGFSVMASAPFMPLYQMEFLKMSAFTVQLILAANVVGVVLTSRFWGLLCDTYGQRPVILVCVVGKAFIPLAMLLAPRDQSISIPLLSVAMFFDGTMGSGMGLAIQSYLFKFAPRRNRTMYIGSNNFFQGIAIGAAPFIAGDVIEVLNRLHPLEFGIYTFNGYHAIFAASFVMRLSSWLFALTLREPQSVPFRTVFAHVRTTNPFRVVRTVYRLHQSTDEGERLGACRTLGEIGTPLAIGDLIGALRDPCREVRHAAADALGSIGMGEASEPLARALVDDSLGIQSPAARALGRIGDFNSLKALLANLQNLDPETLSDTIDSLARIGDSAAILPLICLFDEMKDQSLRRKIASALGRLSQTDSVEEVMAALGVGRHDHYPSPGIR